MYFIINSTRYFFLFSSTQMLNFVIRGDTVIDLKVSELIVLRFGLPATTSSAFFGPNVLTNLAYLLGVSSDKLRRVQIVSASNTTYVELTHRIIFSIAYSFLLLVEFVAKHH